MAKLVSSCRVFLALTAFTVILISACLVWVADTVIHNRDEALDSIIEHQDKDNTIVYAKNKEVIAEVFSEYRIYTPYNEIPQIIIDAVLAIEDRHFFEHYGLDFKAIFRALYHNIKEKKIKQGASTITQQLIKNYSLNREKKFRRKIKEVFLSVELERVLSKEKILSIYLNNLYLGNRSYGIGAAAQRYFGMTLAKLNIAEMVMIAGLFRSPSQNNPIRFPKRASNRQQQVLKAMIDSGKISRYEMHEISAMPLRFKNYKSHWLNTAPHFVDHVIKQTEKILNLDTVKNKGLRIYTTLDTKMQKQAQLVAKNTNKITSNAKGMEFALISTNPKNGHVLSMIGGRDYNKSKFNRATQSSRPAGSAFKPIVYSYALSKGVSWNDVAFIAPIAFDNYRPRERRNEIMKETTLYRSFYKSLNLPVIELGNKFGIKNIIKFAQRFGIYTKLKEELGTVLGSSDIRMFEMANMYSVFANYGTLIEQVSITKIEDRYGNVIYRMPSLVDRREQVISKQISFLMISAMQDVFRLGTARNYFKFHNWAAGKTGTSDDARDNWFCGFSKNIVTIVWLGNDDFTQNSPKSFGSTVALPLWAKYMNAVTEPKKRRNFSPPQGVVSSKINPLFGNVDKKGIEMYFLTNKKPANRNSPYKTLTENDEFRGLFQW